jgi:hypothetical protein
MTVSGTGAPEVDNADLARALLMISPDAIESEVRPISPEIADLLQAHRNAVAIEMAERTAQETIREVNRERTRLLVKDQLRMLLRLDDRDIARLAAAEMLSREPASNRTVTYANGDVGSIGYEETGSIYANIYRCAPWHYGSPRIARA